MAKLHPALQVTDISKKGHVGILHLFDTWSHRHVEWASSPPMRDDYVVNFKMTHSYLCSGMLAAQFDKFCNFSDIGQTSERFKRGLYPTFAEAVEQLAHESMNVNIATEVHNANVAGISIATDARHGCCMNSYRSDVIAIG